VHAPAALHLDEIHAVDATLAVVTAVLGAVGLLAVLADANGTAAATGGAGVVLGLWGQLISRTRSERVLDVIGIGMAAVAFALGMAFGAVTFNG
jgi:hypothetical protein